MDLEISGFEVSLFTGQDMDYFICYTYKNTKALRRNDENSSKSKLLRGIAKRIYIVREIPWESLDCETVKSLSKYLV